MKTLPLECYYIIFYNLHHDYKNLFSCALVNRHWCRVIIPILWSKPNLKDMRLIRIFLLTLNVNEQALLVPFKITLPDHPKPLFEYTNYITSINSYYLHYGVKFWLACGGFEMRKLDKIPHELENAIESSLVTMLLRTSKNLKSLHLNEIICNQLIFENLHENTTVTSMNLGKISDDFKSKAIDLLVKILYTKSTLTSLNFGSNKLEPGEMKMILEVLYKNTTLNSLNFNSSQILVLERKE
ncbi:f-box domain-containing protein [Gigaspora margarita]|uniref:F-box domain-containing protein n=1 Tax=Gigaspora margarita TaxID=4874 RepID=A0A8H4ARQ0_GIGMA|nr:f-box domain-containing protein [Gigaspora margarita]